MAVELKLLGNQAFAEKDFDSALVYYEQAINAGASVTDKAILLSNRSACHANLGCWKLACDEAEKCVYLDPLFARGFQRLEIAMKNLGKNEEANIVKSRACDLTSVNLFVIEDNNNFVQMSKEGNSSGIYIAMINKRVDLNFQEEWHGMTALMYAAKGGHLKSTNFLLAGGASLNLKSKNGWTALLFAVKYYHPIIVERLLCAGADANISDDEDSTALTVAAGSKNCDVLSVLLRCDQIDVNNQRGNGYTALMLAAGHGRVEAVKILIESGARLDLVDNCGFTALDIAKQRKRRDVQAILEQAASKIVEGHCDDNETTPPTI